MNSNERDERLKQIREGDQPWRRTAHEIADVYDGYVGDIEFLLALLDSQAELPSGHREGFIQGYCEAATRMRELCVAKVRVMRDDWRKGGEWESEEYADASEKIITALQSLTLDQVEEKP